MSVSNVKRLLKLVMLQLLSENENPYLTQETLILRIFKVIAGLANVSWPSLMDAIKQGTCRLNQDLHEQILEIWEPRRRQATQDEVNCVERILARDHVRPSDLMKFAIVLGKQTPNRAVWKLFAVDNFQGIDVKRYVDHFKWNDDDVKSKHVDAVRGLYDKGVENPEEIREIIENVFNKDGSTDTELEKYYVDTVCLENIAELREWKRKQSDEEDKSSVAASSSKEPTLKKRRKKCPSSEVKTAKVEKD